MYTSKVQGRAYFKLKGLDGNQPFLATRSLYRRMDVAQKK